MTADLSSEQAQRWTEVLDLLVEVVPPGATGVIVDSFDGHSRVVADRLAVALRAGGRSSRCPSPRRTSARGTSAARIRPL